MPAAVAAPWQSCPDHPLVGMETAAPGPGHAMSLPETPSETFITSATVVLSPNPPTGSGELVKRGMSDEGKGRQGFIPTDWAGAECVSDAKGILTDRGAGHGRDQRADGSRRHAGTGLAQICEAVRQSSGRGRRRWAIRRVVAGLSVSPGRS